MALRLEWAGLSSWRQAAPPDGRRRWGANGSEVPKNVVALPLAGEEPASLAEWGAMVLATPDPSLKAGITHRAYELWSEGRMPVGVAEALSVPARPSKPELVHPRSVPSAKRLSIPTNVHMLHTLAHIELNAMDLAWDTVVRFSASRDELGLGLERQFFADFAHVADDESRHFCWCLQRLEELDSFYGCMPAHNKLWNDCQKTSSSIEARMAIIPLVQEARGLDAGPRLVTKLRQLGDRRSADIVQQISEEEVAHVAVGVSWFHNICEMHQNDPSERFKHLMVKYSVELKGPFNHQARTIAGIPQRWNIHRVAEPIYSGTDCSVQLNAAAFAIANFAFFEPSELEEKMGSDGASGLDFLDVKIREPTVVLPEEHTEECTLFLSNIDQVLAYYVETVYFYEKAPENVVELLHDTLGKLLVPYHFMAGRLRINPEIGKMELHCNREGVLFAGADCALKITDLGDISIPNPLFRKLVLQAAEAKRISDAPLLTMQVTKFQCGGFALGVSMNHSAVDGIAALEFFSNFCSIARGDGMQVVPNPDRSMLKARSPPRVTYDHQEYIKLSDLIAAQTAFTTADALEGDLPTGHSPVKHVYKSFEFGPDKVAALKKRACEDGTIEKCSTFEVVVAHLWQSRTRAVQMDPDTPSKLFFAVDIRNRVEPSLPKGFAGNGVLSAPCVTTLSRDVCEKPLSFCVGKVQEGIRNVTDEYVRSSIDHGELYKGVPALFGGIFISPWWRIPFQELDFGWGRPIYAGPVVNEKVEFVLLLNNGKQDAGLNVYLALEPAQMELLEREFET